MIPWSRSFSDEFKGAKKEDGREIMQAPLAQTLASPALSFPLGCSHSLGRHNLDGPIFEQLEIDPMSKYLNAFVSETFEQNGQEKTRYTKVGVAFPHKERGGFSIKIASGIAVSGELILFPPSEKDQKSQEG